MTDFIEVQRAIMGAYYSVLRKLKTALARKRLRKSEDASARFFEFSDDFISRILLAAPDFILFPNIKKKKETLSDSSMMPKLPC